MKKLIFGLVLIGVLSVTSLAGAQTSLKFDQVQIQFWPEYDRPEMLVIFTLELPAEQALPVELSVRIPARVASPTAVAVLEGNQLVTREYSLSSEDPWTVVTLTADSPVIQLEYYDPLLSQSDRSRDFQFEWFFDYPLDELVIAVKQPVHAVDLVFSPDLGVPTAGADGLDFYSASFGALPAGEVFAFSLQYQKSDDLLSAELLSQPLAEESVQPGATAGQQNQFPAWGWVIVGAGAVIIAAGGVYLWSINTPTAFSRYRQKKARSRTARSGVPDVVYCHQCGFQAKRGDNFCRECGEKLRR
ncbi:MAG: hypothetical protein JW757_08270 [Anaerolineales bacterium]|nr:hypothetical protein [Anaerolineales bacterium]